MSSSETSMASDADGLPQLSSSERLVHREAVHREQVWAALIRAVSFLLGDELDDVERELSRAQQSGDEALMERLLARQRVLRELTRQVLSPPPR